MMAGTQVLSAQAPAETPPTRVHGRSTRADRRDELAAHRREALAFVDAAWPHLSALERMAIELGPVALHHSRILANLLTGYERRHLGDDEAAA